MTTLSPNRALPTAAEVAIARESGRALSAYLQTRAETQQIEIFDDKGASHPVRVPVSALRDRKQHICMVGRLVGRAKRLLTGGRSGSQH